MKLLLSEIAQVLSGERRWCVINADCLTELPTLPEKSVAHVITDPPYSDWVHAQEKKAGTRRDGTARLSPIDFLALTSELRDGVSAEIGRLCQRWCLVFSDAESNSRWRESLEAGGLRHVRACAWIKPDASPQFSGDRPSAAFELVQVSHPKGPMRWNGGGARGLWTHGVERQDRHHATPKPLPLMLELVDLFTDPDDVVLDPFAGSGTTGVACLRLGRRFIGIEKDAAFAQVASERLTAESQGLTLRAARAGQLSLLGGL